MSNVNGKLAPQHRRSKLGRTRYYPRCSMRGCAKPLDAGKHVGPCKDCTKALKALFESDLQRVDFAQNFSESA